MNFSVTTSKISFENETKYSKDSSIVRLKHHCFKLRRRGKDWEGRRGRREEGEGGNIDIKMAGICHWTDQNETQNQGS